MERGWKPHAQISPPCPRCGSSNTKFCYYNNYSLTQPRYFCKGCRRYWTKGGSLRNVPVGGGCRKSRKGKPFGASSTHDNANGNGIPSSRGVFVGGHVNHGMAPMLSESIHGSLAGAEGSNIDLALVYANFLNQKPVGPQADQAESHHHQLEIPLLPNAIGGGPYDSFQLSSVESINMDLTNHQLSRESSFTECRSLSDHRFSDTHFSDSNASYFYGLDSIEKQQATDYNQLSSTTMNQINNYMLPALPGEELTVSDEIVLPALPGEELTVSDEKVWPADSDHHIMFPSHMLRANQLSGIESQAQEPDGQLDIENGSQFNDSIELCNVSRP